jgi:cytochrome c-type biogenesis protein CcmH
VRGTLSNELTQDFKKHLNKGALYMADKFWMRCGLLVCGVLLAATVPAYSEPAAPAKPNGQAGQSLAISGKVIMGPSLAGKGSSTDTLFVFAREVNGPPMPVAIVRATKKDLPFTFRLDDSNGMMPSRKLSDVGTVVIVARLSKSGKAMPESGDLEGMSQPVKPGVDGITIVIDRERP